MKEKPYTILRYHKKDKCPKSNDIIDYWRCTNCSSSGNQTWATWGKNLTLLKFTVKCGFPIKWGWHGNKHCWYKDKEN